MADNRKLAQGLMMMTPAMREDLARTASDYEKFKQADYLRKMGEQGMGLAKSVARGVPQMATGLVDLASLPFEAAGVLQPGQAVGSTKWLESQGYLPEQQEGFANQLTELLSGGFDPSDLVTKGAPLLMGVGKTVWHGSPHSFEKFDLSKIGTGEGVQAYGHGLYLAESPDVAQGYQKKLSQLTKLVDGEVTKDLSSSVVGTQLKQFGGDAEKTKNYFLAKAAEYEKMGQSYKPALSQAEQYKNYANYVDDLSKKSFEQNTGSLYKVDLPDEQIAKMLDWDKPLSEQPEAYAAIQKYAKETQHNPESAMRMLEGKTAGEAYQMWNQPEYVSQFLNEQGVPGIQYLDQASRGAGDGTRNYVVFSDEIPQILERNGQPVGLFGVKE